MTMGNIERKLKELGIELPIAPRPVANFVSAVTSGNRVYTAGTGPRMSDGKLLYIGKLGADVSVEQGQEAARLCTINILGVLKEHLGDLDRVKRIVKLLAFVNSTSDFHMQPQVINGASDLLVEVFGENGIHARSAIGTNVLPSNMPVEIEMIVEIWDEKK